MYVEDKEDKIVREAKIKAHGACIYHKDHFSGDSYFAGIMTVISVGLVGLFLYTIASGISKAAVQAYAAEHPQVSYSTQAPADGQTTFTICDENNNCRTK